jgi:2-polyprenyl-3-methyl-5-hydroxy-6-metoxy-1,4-benzoquinol methylase
MQQEAFTILRQIEQTWWHYGRVEAVLSALGAASVTQTKRVLDVGAGYGGMFALLSSYGLVDATEPEDQAALVCKERGYNQVYKTESEIPSDTSYDLIGAFDVIEHVDDDVTFVQNLYTHTSDGGLLVATVPAFQFLWGPHDVTHMHFRRHTNQSMKTLFARAGYEVVYVRYWNVLLFPIACLMRLLKQGGESSLHPHPFIAFVLKRLLSVEARIVRHVPIPFGLSVVIVGKKK